MKIVKEADKLSVPCEEFNFETPQVDPEQFAKDLVKTMYDHDGLGLAANQVGHNIRVFAMRGPKSDYVIFNPKIVSLSNETIELEEGCLSFPNLLVKITRPQHLRIRFADFTGEVDTFTFTGLTARIVQHEVEHLDGKLFFSNVTRMRLVMATKDAEKRGSRYPGLLKYCKEQK